MSDLVSFPSTNLSPTARLERIKKLNRLKSGIRDELNQISSHHCWNHRLGIFLDRGLHWQSALWYTDRAERIRPLRQKHLTRPFYLKLRALLESLDEDALGLILEFSPYHSLWIFSDGQDKPTENGGNPTEEQDLLPE